MAKREHFVTHVTCPECALNGSATWEENESGNLETTVKSLSQGFKIGPDRRFIVPTAASRPLLVKRYADPK